MAETQSIGEWRRGWPALIAGAAGISLTTIHIYATGLFIQPLEAEFGWPRAEVSSAMVLPSIIAFFLTPIGGRFIDRLGARRVALAGTVFYCLAVMALSFTTSWIFSWWLLWALMGFALSVLSPAVWSTGVASWFDRHRAIALALALCGTGIGASLVPILTNWLIDNYGWRGAFVGLGLTGLAVILPILFVFFFDGRRTKPQGDDLAETSAVPLGGYGVHEGLRSRAFFRLAVAGFGGTAAIVGVLVHLVPILSTYGIDRTTAAWLVGLVGIPSIIGRLSVGFLLDRYSGPAVGAVSISLPILSVALLVLFPGNVPAAIVAIIILGLSIGGEYDAVIYLSTRYLGLKNFGSLFSYIAALITLGLGLGPALGGLVYDLSGSYRLYFAILIPIWAISGLMLATLGPNPHASGR
ncbi:MFS transporter [Sphingomonas sp.]|uniref:MFS transporter n=1 Tax=Sphingomonas sp. TaxID=28214 RepID=UPI003F708B60